MATENGSEALAPDEALERAMYVARAKKVRWFDMPPWAWKYKVEGVFGQTRAYWLSED